MNNKELEKVQKDITPKNTFDPNMELTKEIGIEMVNRLKSFNSIGTVIKSALKEGIDADYAIIPGTNRPTLLQPGARKIALLFGLNAEYKILRADCDYDKTFSEISKGKYGEYKKESLGTFNYVVETKLFRGEQLISSGIGSASNKEKGKIDMNDNSVLKIAKKRSFVDAILMISNMSSVFTQDMEDYTKPKQQVKTQATKNTTTMSDDDIDNMINDIDIYDIK